MNKQFHLGDVLTITTGNLVSPRHIQGVYEILNFMTGDNLYTHQLPRARRECRGPLLEQFPQLAEVDASGVDQNNWRDWLAEQVDKYGEYLWVATLTEYTHIDPLLELETMVNAQQGDTAGPSKTTGIIILHYDKEEQS